MGADMLLRSIYLLAGQQLNLTAAKAVATDLAANAGLAKLHILVRQGWIGEDHLITTSPTDDELAGLADTLRAEAEQALHAHLDQFAASLHSRAVAHHRFGNEPDAIDAYTTGGLSWGDPPGDAYAAWDVVLDDGAYPPTWPLLLGATAGLLHPHGPAPAVATVAFHAWA